MFGSKKETVVNNSNNNTTSSNGGLNSLVVGTHIEGEVKAESDIRIDGGIKGSLVCKSKVIIGPGGKVEGTVRCTNAVIEGTFTGTIHVSEVLKVTETAKIDGEVFTQKLQVDSGAVFNVSCAMGGVSRSNKDKSAKLVKEKAGV